jgi:hypothetical protein
MASGVEMSLGRRLTPFTLKVAGFMRSARRAPGFNVSPNDRAGRGCSRLAGFIRQVRAPEGQGAGNAAGLPKCRWRDRGAADDVPSPHELVPGTAHAELRPAIGRRAMPPPRGCVASPGNRCRCPPFSHDSIAGAPHGLSRTDPLSLDSGRDRPCRGLGRPPSAERPKRHPLPTYVAFLGTRPDELAIVRPDRAFGPRTLAGLEPAGRHMDVARSSPAASTASRPGADWPDCSGVSCPLGDADPEQDFSE